MKITSEFLTVAGTLLGIACATSPSRKLASHESEKITVPKNYSLSIRLSPEPLEKLKIKGPVLIECSVDGKKVFTSKSFTAGSFNSADVDTSVDEKWFKENVLRAALNCGLKSSAKPDSPIIQGTDSILYPFKAVANHLYGRILLKAVLMRWAVILNNAIHEAKEAVASGDKGNISKSVDRLVSLLYAIHGSQFAQSIDAQGKAQTEWVTLRDRINLSEWKNVHTPGQSILFYQYEYDFADQFNTYLGSEVDDLLIEPLLPLESKSVLVQYYERKQPLPSSKALQAAIDQEAKALVNVLDQSLSLSASLKHPSVMYVDVKETKDLKAPTHDLANEERIYLNNFSSGQKGLLQYLKGEKFNLSGKDLCRFLASGGFNGYVDITEKYRTMQIILMADDLANAKGQFFYNHWVRFLDRVPLQGEKIDPDRKDPCK